MKYSSRDFTFGVELEGLFTKKLLTNLSRMGFDSDSFHSDGSVDGSSIFSNIPDSVRKTINTHYTEVSLGIFHSRKALIDLLEMFDPKNYFQDESCGLHLHVGVGNDNSFIKSTMTDYQFVEKLQKASYKNLCDHVKMRQRSSYCKPYADANHFMNHFVYGHDKYRFVNNHEQGTWEFRFLSACEHKIDNVKTFLAEFFSDLRELEPRKRHKIKLEIPATRNIDMNWAVARMSNESQTRQYVRTNTPTHIPTRRRGVLDHGIWRERLMNMQGL